MLDLETELHMNCNIENINKLMRCYSDLIEHFDKVGDSRYLVYQERMHEMLTRSDVLRCTELHS